MRYQIRATFLTVIATFCLLASAEAKGKNATFKCRGGWEFQVHIRVPVAGAEDASELRGQMQVDLINGFPPITLVEKRFSTKIVSDVNLELTSLPDGDFKYQGVVIAPFEFWALEKFDASLDVSNESGPFTSRDLKCERL